MSLTIIDADPRYFFVIFFSHDAIVPCGHCVCGICDQPVLVSRYNEHLLLHRDVIDDLRRRKH